jgi:hypothetical protein
VKDLHRIDCSIEGFDQDLVRRRLGLLEIVNDLRLGRGLFENDSFHVGLKMGSKNEELSRQSEKEVHSPKGQGGSIYTSIVPYSFPPFQ